MQRRYLELLELHRPDRGSELLLEAGEVEPKPVAVAFLEEGHDEQRIVERADVEQVVAGLRLCSSRRAAQRVYDGLQEQLRQALLLIANRLAVHFRHVAERLPLGVARISHEEIIRFHRSLATRNGRLLHKRLLGDDVRELIDELRHVVRGLGEELVVLVLAEPQRSGTEGWRRGFRRRGFVRTSESRVHGRV